MATDSYGVLRRDNERIAATINGAWGERVAWVEPEGFPAIVSHLVGGMLSGRRGYPPFFAGPATTVGTWIRKAA